MGQRNELWGSLSTFTTIDTCSENQCLKHPVAKLDLYSYVVVWARLNLTFVETYSLHRFLLVIHHTCISTFKCTHRQ